MSPDYLGTAYEFPAPEDLRAIEKVHLRNDLGLDDRLRIQT